MVALAHAPQAARRPAPRQPATMPPPRVIPLPRPTREPLPVPQPSRELPPAALLAWAYGALYDRLVHRARTILWTLGWARDAAADDAEEIVSAVFTSAAEKLCDYWATCNPDLPRDEAEMRRWLYARVRWYCLNAAGERVRISRTFGHRVALVLDVDAEEAPRGSVNAADLVAPDVELPAPPCEAPGMRFSPRLLFALAQLSTREAGLLVGHIVDGMEREDLLKRYPIRRWDGSTCQRATPHMLSLLAKQLTAAKTHLHDAYTSHADAPDDWQPSPRDAQRYAAPVEPDAQAIREEQARIAALPWWARPEDWLPPPPPKRRRRKRTVVDTLLAG